MIERGDVLPGDLLLFRIKHSSSWIAKLIGWGQKIIRHAPTKAEYCHVAIVAFDTDFILEATWPKTRISKINWEKWNKEYDLQLFCVKNITPMQVVDAIFWAEDHLGEWYDILALFDGWVDIRHAEICSTYVQKAYKAAGVEFKVDERNFITPDEIAASDLVERVK
jgi:cell wall-associated NlpC family hydrolase